MLPTLIFPIALSAMSLPPAASCKEASDALESAHPGSAEQVILYNSGAQSVSGLFPTARSTVADDRFSARREVPHRGGKLG